MELLVPSPSLDTCIPISVSTPRQARHPLHVLDEDISSGPDLLKSPMLSLSESASVLTLAPMPQPKTLLSSPLSFRPKKKLKQDVRSGHWGGYDEAGDGTNRLRFRISPAPTKASGTLLLLLFGTHSDAHLVQAMSPSLPILCTTRFRLFPRCDGLFAGRSLVRVRRGASLCCSQWSFACNLLSAIGFAFTLRNLSERRTLPKLLIPSVESKRRCMVREAGSPSKETNLETACKNTHQRREARAESKIATRAKAM